MIIFFVFSIFVYSPESKESDGGEKLVRKADIHISKLFAVSFKYFYLFISKLMQYGARAMISALRERTMPVRLI